MEAIVLIILASLILAFAGVWLEVVPKRHRRDATELKVEKELNRILSRSGYIIFGDLIIPSVSGQVASTQIDHVVVSVYGIFCIETKSHHGNIYGNVKSKEWKQYLGKNAYTLYSPLKQNHHHVQSLEYILRSRLRAPVHSYVVFPNAHKVKLNGSIIDFSLHHAVQRILSHTTPVYTLEDVEAIARGLAYISEHTPDFADDHVKAVASYVERYRR